MSKLRKWMMKEERDSTSSGSGEDLSSSAIKLFGKTIAVSGGGDSISVSVSNKAGSEEGDGASTQLEGNTLGSGQKWESGGGVGSVLNVGVSENLATMEVEAQAAQAAQAESQPGGEEANPLLSSSLQQQPEKQRALTQEEKKEQCLKKPDKLIPCPRCESVDTKFCYYNNYNINQPRHFCKSCQRYWTAGGTLRNVLVGAGRRKNKYGVTQPKQDAENLGVRSVVRVDHHEPAQQSLLTASMVNVYGSTVHTLGTVPPMNLPTHGSSPRSASESQAGSTSTPTGASSQGFPVFSSMSAFKPTGVETSSDSVTKLRQRTRTESASDTKADCASSMSSPTGEANSNTYVLTPRAPPQQTEAQAVWSKSAAPLGFFNGAWPYGYNIGWSGAGPMPGAPPMASAPPPVWTGMWTSGMAQGGISPVPAFGWNMLQGGWTLPWRPVPVVGVQMQTPSRKRESANSATEDVMAKMARVASDEVAV